jgi:hypothetical protein
VGAGRRGDGGESRNPRDLILRRVDAALEERGVTVAALLRRPKAIVALVPQVNTPTETARESERERERPHSTPRAKRDISEL